MPSRDNFLLEIVIGFDPCACRHLYRWLDGSSYWRELVCVLALEAERELVPHHAATVPKAFHIALPRSEPLFRYWPGQEYTAKPRFVILLFVSRNHFSSFYLPRFADEKLKSTTPWWQ